MADRLIMLGFLVIWSSIGWYITTNLQSARATKRENWGMAIILIGVVAAWWRP